MLQQMFSENQNLSLKKLAINLNVNYNMLLKKSKEPVKGQAYDPTSTNFEALEAYLITKLGKEAFDNTDWAKLSSDSTTVREAQLPKEFALGALVILRNDSVVYNVFAKTPTHVILMPHDMTQSTTPRLLNHHTFLHQGPRVYEINTEE